MPFGSSQEEYQIQGSRFSPVQKPRKNSTRVSLPRLHLSRCTRTYSAFRFMTSRLHPLRYPCRVDFTRANLGRDYSLEPVKSQPTLKRRSREWQLTSASFKGRLTKGRLACERRAALHVVLRGRQFYFRPLPWPYAPRTAPPRGPTRDEGPR